MLVEQSLHLPLCAPLLANEATEEVGIGDIGLIGRVVVPVVKHALQPIHIGPFAPHESRQPLHIVRRGKGIAPCRALMKSRDVLKVLACGWVEVAQEGTVLPDGSQRAIRLVVVASVAQCSAGKLLGTWLVAQRVGQLTDGIVGHAVLQGVRHRVVTREVTRKVAHGDISLGDIGVYVGAHGVLSSRRGGRLEHSLIGRADVKVP